MADIKVVIGANFGDEGKGLMTDYFAYQAKKNKQSCLVVCHNGGAQRGHTVTLFNGTRHVFHHFGSGTFQGACTYLSADYIVNPFVFREEYETLCSLGYKPVVYVNRHCMWSTPYDAFINQIVEENRGDNRHGSCGLGIWETIVRCQKMGKNSLYNSKTAFREINDYIRHCYLPKRLKELHCTPSNTWLKLIKSNELFEHFIDDICFMLANITFVNNEIISRFDSIIFEGGQGLLLDQNRTEYGNNTTPSNTGSSNPKNIISRLKNDYEIELCYVTRSYMTRHGAGRFDEECDVGEINPKIEDKTNTPNPFQGTIRYGKLNYDELYRRIEDDIAVYPAKKSLAITHCNELNADNDKLQQLFGQYQIYQSDGLTCYDVYKL